MVSFTLTSNIPAYTAQSAYNRANTANATNIARLSSGSRITQASDDTASLSIATNISAKLSGLRAAQGNVSQATSMLQIADQALSQVTEALQRQKELTVRASSGDLNDTQRGFLSIEFSQLSSEIERIANETNFNGKQFFSSQVHSITTLAQTNTQAFNAIQATASLQVAGGGNAVRSNTPIQAFHSVTSASLAGIAAAGRLQFVDSNGVLLTDAAYSDIDTSVHGSFDSFTFSDITYGGTGIGRATLNATLNGQQFSGRLVAGNNIRVILSNGNTNIQMHVGNINLQNSASAQNSAALVATRFQFTTIARTSSISGVNFTGTALAGAIGNATTGIANIRLDSGELTSIGNFQYLSNRNTANSNTISVEVNGKLFVADNVRDQITGGILQFRGESRLEMLSINLAGLSTNITNIRTRPKNREDFIDALNQSFASINTGVSVTVNDDARNGINVNFGNATTKELFGNAQLSVNTSQAAAEAGRRIDRALEQVNALRANVGAASSRLDFAAAVLTTSIQNQQAARSVLADTDIAASSTDFAQSQVLSTFAGYALAQANTLNGNLLELLPGDSV